MLDRCHVFMQIFYLEEYERTCMNMYADDIQHMGGWHEIESGFSIVICMIHPIGFSYNNCDPIHR